MPTRRAVLAAAFAGAIKPPIALAVPEPAARTVLRLEKRTIEVNGRAAGVYGIRQPDGKVGMATRMGDRFRVRVENRIGEPSLVHWHGLAPPWRQDGVPGVSGPPIAAGGSADYDFPLGYGGTFWMHSHQGLQEQLLLSAPLIIRDPHDPAGRQQIIVSLDDFSFTPPAEIFAKLKKPAAMPAMNMAAAGGGAMPPDLNDVKYDAFLANDHTLADPEIVRVEPGGRVWLRVINSSAMSSYHFDLGRLEGRLIAVDGARVVPVSSRRFPINVAQRLDILLTMPKGPGAYPILATVEGARNRSGIVLAAGKAPVARISALAERPAPEITMALERRLRASEPLKPRRPDRIHRIDLTGDMARYVWSINGVPWNPQVPPLPVKKGERVSLVLTSKTPMPHPMHLHGHRFQVVEVDGTRIAGAVRDTVRVPPKGRVVIVFDADNPGRWAFHCHMLYHMEAGMFTTLRYI